MKEKSTDFACNFYIVDFGEFLARKKRPLKALIEFFHTVFKTPDIYKNQINGHALTGRSAVGYCAGYPTEKLHVF